MTYVLLALGTAVAIALGVFGVVFGEADDSPGLQVLGALLVIGAVTYAVRTVRRLRRPQGGHP